MKIQNFYMSKYSLSLLIFIWLCLIGTGFYRIINYHAQAGAAVEVPNQPVLNQKLKYLDESGNSILCFIHPLCPCSKTTISEFEYLIEQPGKVPGITIIFPYPVGKEEWVEQALIQYGSSLKKCTLIEDPDGVITAKFGVQTSGHTVVYKNHQLIFSGGLTPARGHEADSWSRIHVEKMFLDDERFLITTPCYGCRLYLAQSQ